MTQQGLHAGCHRGLDSEYPGSTGAAARERLAGPSVSGRLPPLLPRRPPRVQRGGLLFRLLQVKTASATGSRPRPSRASALACHG